LVTLAATVILEHFEKFFVVVFDASDKNSYIVRKCETFLEAGLIHREAQKFILSKANPDFYWTKEVADLSSKNYCEILVNKLIESGAEYIFPENNSLYKDLVRIMTT
jgi:hypothetical protein